LTSAGLRIAAAALAAALACGAGTAASPQAQALPGKGEAGPWVLSAPPESYERDGLFGYIDGGAEIFLQYRFARLDLGRYELAAEGTKKEITCEIYRMGSPLDAFGIFSVKREGSEGASPALPDPNIFDAGQASFVRGSCYVNILGTGTSAPEMDGFARAVVQRLPAEGDDPLQAIARLPREGIRPRSERFIKGELAAQAESDLLSDPRWKFAAGTTAVSARYGEPPSRLVLMEFADDDPERPAHIWDLFIEALGRAEIRDGVVEARNAAGSVILFSARGRTGALVIGRSGPDAARRPLAQAFR